MNRTNIRIEQPSDYRKVEEITASIADEVVVPANYNSPGQLVISGSVEAVDAAFEKGPGLLAVDVRAGQGLLNGVSANFEGQSINTIFVVESLGINPATGVELFRDRTGGITETWDPRDKVPWGVNEPKLWGSFNTSLQLRGFTLNAIFGYRTGGSYYNQTLADRVENIYPYDNVDRRAYSDRWKEPGDHAMFKAIGDFTTTNASSRFVMRENTLECRSVSLHYECRSEWLERNMSLSYLSVGAYMDDVFRLSSIRQERGLNYPFSKKFSFSLTARF